MAVEVRAVVRDATGVESLSSRFDLDLASCEFLMKGKRDRRLDPEGALRWEGEGVGDVGEPSCWPRTVVSMLVLVLELTGLWLVVNAWKDFDVGLGQGGR